MWGLSCYYVFTGCQLNNHVTNIIFFYYKILFINIFLLHLSKLIIQTMEEIGDLYTKLTELCKEKKISLREVCKLADVNYITVTKWKRGTPSTVQTIDKLINILNNN